MNAADIVCSNNSNNTRSSTTSTSNSTFVLLFWIVAILVCFLPSSASASASTSASTCASASASAVTGVTEATAASACLYSSFYNNNKRTPSLPSHSTRSSCGRRPLAFISPGIVLQANSEGSRSRSRSLNQQLELDKLQTATDTTGTTRTTTRRRRRRSTVNSMGLFHSKEREIPVGESPQNNETEDDEWLSAQVKRIQQQCCDDPWYQHKLAISKTTVQVADEYVGTRTDGKALFPGVHKYLGGAKDDRDGCIYGIPSHARSVICLYPTNKDDTNTTPSRNEKVAGGAGVEYKIRLEPLPEHAANGQFKWLRGIIAHGYLYGIPAWANTVLEVDIDAMWGRRKATGPIVNLIPLPEGHVPSQWQWHGASLNQEKTAIYSIPSNAHQVLKVDLKTHTTSLIDIHIPTRYKDFSFHHSNKWYGGILGDDNAVYGIPYRTCALLRIDTEHDTATIVGDDHGCKRFNWHGGAKVNGFIYAFPSHADTVLKIDTSPTSRGQISTQLPIHRASYDDDTNETYKWLGGAIGADGNIYAMPADASAILKIDTHTDHCSTFGFVGTVKNKWQGGVLSPTDGCIYCIPADGEHVLRIDTSKRSSSSNNNDENENDKDSENAIALVGALPNRKNKWQGAFFGNDGIMYAIPENGYRILMVHPSQQQQQHRDLKTGHVPDDVRVELL